MWQSYSIFNVFYLQKGKLLIIEPSNSKPKGVFNSVDTMIFVPESEHLLHPLTFEVVASSDMTEKNSLSTSTFNKCSDCSFVIVKTALAQCFDASGPSLTFCTITSSSFHERNQWDVRLNIDWTVCKSIMGDSLQSQSSFRIQLLKQLENYI